MEGMQIIKLPIRSKDGKALYNIKANGIESGPYTADDIEGEVYAFLVRTA